jgi:hypothetical protein
MTATQPLETIARTEADKLFIQDIAREEEIRTFYEKSTVLTTIGTIATGALYAYCIAPHVGSDPNDPLQFTILVPAFSGMCTALSAFGIYLSSVGINSRCRSYATDAKSYMERHHKRALVE